MLNQKNGEFSLMNFPAYKSAWDKLMELRGQADELRKQAEELRTKGRPESVKTQRQKQIDAVILGVEPDSVKSTEGWRTELNEAQSRGRLFQDAAKRQEEEVTRQRLIASREICEKLMPKHRDIVKRLALAYIELGKVVVEEKVLREALNDNDVGYSSYIRPMVIHGPGDPRDPTSRIANWLMEAIEYDFISISDLPREWRSELEKYINAKKRKPVEVPKATETKRVERIREGWIA